MEDEESFQKSSTPESDEEDDESYFLQPASCPYNILDKIKEANIALFNNTIDMDNRQSKVKFREALVDYEPDFTYDDASSIESDHETLEYDLVEDDTHYLENDEKLNICLINEEMEEIEILEEVLEDDEISATPIVEVFSSESEPNEPEIKSASTVPLSDTKTHSSGAKFPKLDYIECKKHCIDRLDYDFNMSITRMNLEEKPPEYLALKLQQRKCCEKKEIRIPQKLPCYTGLRSEYGLSLDQIKRRERMKETVNIRKKERQKIVEENKRRRMEQNEEIFCAWLKSISQRKEQKKKSRKSASATVISTSNSVNQSYRPKTANQLPKREIRKTQRPNSSPFVFIQVPRVFLKKGIQVGDLMVEKTDSISKKLHFLTIS